MACELGLSGSPVGPQPLLWIGLGADPESGKAPSALGMETKMRLQEKGTRFFSTRPLVDNVVQHKRPIVEREVVFWRARGPGPKFGSVWCFGRTCRPVLSVQLLGFLQGHPGVFFSWACSCGSSYVGALFGITTSTHSSPFSQPSARDKESLVAVSSVGQHFAASYKAGNCEGWENSTLLKFVK